MNFLFGSDCFYFGRQKLIRFRGNAGCSAVVEEESRFLTIPGLVRNSVTETGHDPGHLLLVKYIPPLPLPYPYRSGCYKLTLSSRFHSSSTSSLPTSPFPTTFLVLLPSNLLPNTTFRRCHCCCSPKIVPDSRSVLASPPLPSHPPTTSRLPSPRFHSRRPATSSNRYPSRHLAQDQPTKCPCCQPSSPEGPGHWHYPNSTCLTRSTTSPYL